MGVHLRKNMLQELVHEMNYIYNMKDVKILQTNINPALSNHKKQEGFLRYHTLPYGISLKDEEWRKEGDGYILNRILQGKGWRMKRVENMKMKG
jgi:hypothetical protein